MINSITLPSGAQVQLRTMSMAEQDALLSSKTNTWLQTLIATLGKCTESVNSWGIYPEGESFDWNEVYEGDLLYGLYQLRNTTHPDPYEFETRCKRCGNTFDVEVDVDELEIIKPSPDVLEVITKGETSITVPVTHGDETVKATIRIRTASQVLKALVSERMDSGRKKAKARSKKKAFEVDLSGHKLTSKIKDFIRTVDDLSPKAYKEWLASVDGGWMPKLFDAIESVSFGVDSDILCDCIHCDAENEVTAPMSSDFFMPLRSRKKRNRKISE